MADLRAFRTIFPGAIGVMLSVATAIMLALVGTLHAQTPNGPYPNQLVRIVVPFAAGSMSDILARVVSDKLSQAWQQQVIVENRPGIAGTASVATARPDGHTVLLTSNGHAIIGKVNRNLPFDPVKDFVGVSKIASMPLILIVPPDSPAQSLTELIELARSRPGRMSYASAGWGTATSIAAELLKQIAKIDVVHVPYKGAPDSQTSVMRGDTQMSFTPAGVGVDLIRAGKLRALAVSSVTRLPNLPSVPTFAEAGLPQFAYDVWFGLLAPASTPPVILQKISGDIGTILKSPAVEGVLATQGVTAASSTPDELTTLLRADTMRFGELLGDVKN